VLRSAGTSFGHAADGLGSLTADAPLTDADAAVPALHTAVACRDAASEVAAVSDEGRGLQREPRGRGTLVREARSGRRKRDREHR
jgi:hypothetical protein